MDRSQERTSVMIVTLMLMSIFVAMVAPQVAASEVVLTDAVQIVNGGSQNDRMVALDSDSEGNVHFVWSRNTQHLYYKLVDARGGWTPGKLEFKPLFSWPPKPIKLIKWLFNYPDGFIFPWALIHFLIVLISYI